MRAGFPIIFVGRRGAAIEGVEWVDPTPDANPKRVPLTEMRVLSVETRIEPGEIPKVAVVFAACLIEEQLP